MIAWKLVRIKDGKFRSVVATKEASLTYSLNRVTRIPTWLKEINRYPHLFSSRLLLLRGINKISNGPDLHVLECECRNQVEIEYLLELYRMKIRALRTNASIIPGTVSYKWVKPIKAFSISKIAEQENFTESREKLRTIRRSHNIIIFLDSTSVYQEESYVSYLYKEDIAIIY